MCSIRFGLIKRALTFWHICWKLRRFNIIWWLVERCLCFGCNSRTLPAVLCTFVTSQCTLIDRSILRRH